MKKTTLNKKTIVQTTTNDTNDSAILMIRESIKNTKTAYRDFLAGAIYLIINDSGKVDSLRQIVRAEYKNESEWQAVKRQYNRRIDNALTLATYRVGVYENKDVQTIRLLLDSDNVTTAYIDNLKNIHANQKNTKTTTPNPVKTATLPRVPQSDFDEGVTKTDENCDTPVLRAFKILKALTPAERIALKKYAESQGVDFNFNEIITIKKAGNLYS